MFGVQVLTLYVLTDTESASEYTFSFQLYNPPQAQLAVQPQISASFIGNSKQLFTAGEGIAAEDMNYPVTEIQNLEDPLFVIEAEFTHLSVAVSSLFPWYLLLPPTFSCSCVAYARALRI